jgi:hypothetical protein
VHSRSASTRRATPSSCRQVTKRDDGNEQIVDAHIDKLVANCLHDGEVFWDDID